MTWCIKNVIGILFWCWLLIPNRIQFILIAALPYNPEPNFVGVCVCVFLCVGGVCAFFFKVANWKKCKKLSIKQGERPKMHTRMQTLHFALLIF